MSTNQLELNGTEQAQIGSRSVIYALLAQGFRFPSAGQFERVKNGQYADEVQAATGDLPHGDLNLGTLGRGTGLSYEQFQSRYIELFDVGGESGAPAFLYEGEYGGGRMKAMEEVLRFYHYFGLRLSAKKRDRPDHLASELEFMHALSFKEAESLLQGKHATPYRDAQRDFLRFHLFGFATEVAKTTGGKGVDFYSDLTRFASDFCQRDLAHLQNGQK
jgi:putative dimethyl sulfoxide reductase chaperone